MLWLSYLSKNPFWDFKLSISFSKFLKFLFSLESLFLLCLSCLFVKGASSNSGCLALPAGLSLSFIGSQVDICGGGRVGLGGLLWVSVVSGPEVLEVHYPEEKLLIQLSQSRVTSQSTLSSESF